MSKLVAGPSTHVDACSTAPLELSHNDVALLVDGPAAFDAMLAAIAQSRSHIHVEIYIYDSVSPGGLGHRFAQALLQKQAQGIEVCLLYDPVGSRNAPRSFFVQLAAQGIRVLDYNPVLPCRARKRWRPNQRDHRKMLIVDGQVAFIGGIDISDEYSHRSYVQLAWGKLKPQKGGWHDIDIRIDGPAVATLQRLFLDTWQRQQGIQLTGNYFPPLMERGAHQVGIAIAHPGNTPNPVRRAYLQALGQARCSIHISNSYFLPDPLTTVALCEAARRGVEVTLLLPGVSDFGALVHGQRYYYDALLGAGVRIFELHRQFVHAKVAVIDQLWSTVGSYNLDLRSLLHAEEVNAIIIGPAFAAQLETVFQADLARARQIRLASWRKRSRWQRLLQAFVHRWRYWL